MTHRAMKWALIGIGIGIVGFWTVQTWAQADAQAGDEAADVESSTQAPPPPGEEVMRPTKHGYRMTPGMAKVMSQAWIAGEVETDISLSDTQRMRLVEAMGRRIMKWAHTHQESGQKFLEYYYEKTAADNGKVHADDTQEFAKRVRPFIPDIRDFLDGVSKDARGILEPDQMEAMTEALAKSSQELDQLDRRMKRWAEEGDSQGGNPVQGLDKEDPEPTKDAKMRTQPRHWAERRAKWSMAQLSDNQWQRFLIQVQRLFKFDDEQIARGKRMLSECRKQARTVMTRQWRERVLWNRTQYFAQQALHGQPIGPWLFHLEREYDKAVKPVLDLGRSFRRDVLALATDEQRDAVFSEIKTAAGEHGMTKEELTSMEAAIRVTAKD